MILGEQDIVHDGDDQASNSKEVERNDDGDGGYGDNSEAENDSSDSSIKLSWKHTKKKCVGQDIFKVLFFFNIVAIRVMNITQQLPFILQHCLKREWD